MKPGSARKRTLYRNPWILSALLGGIASSAILLLLLGDPREGGAAERGAVGRLLSYIGLAPGPGAAEPAAEPAVETGGEDAEETEAASPQKVLDVTFPPDEPADFPWEEDAADDPEGAAPSLGSSSGPALRGRIVDVATGGAIRGVRILAALFRAPGTPEGDLLGVGGTPAIGVEDARSAGDGGFSLRHLLPEDPQVLLHVQAEHPSYAPVVAVLRGRDGAGGLWRDVHEPREAPGSVAVVTNEGAESRRQRLEFRMRRSLTIPVRILDPEDRALPRVPVRVRPWKEGHAFLEEGAVGVAASGRLVKESAAFVLFSDRSGSLRLPFHDTPYDLELLDPGYYLEYRDPSSRRILRGRVTIVLPFTGELLLRAMPGLPSRHRLTDENGDPIASSEVEIALEGMVPLRMLTDAHGGFEVGVMPFPIGEPLLGYSHPRRGRLTVVAPYFLNRSVEISLPFPRDDIVLGARPSRRLRLRLVAGKPEDPSPVEPRGLVTSLGLLPVRMGRDGQAEFAGSLSKSDDSFVLFCRGYRPVSVDVPRSMPSTREVDLGDVALDPGWSREVRLIGGERPLRLEGAQLSIAPAGDPFHEQRYPIPPAGSGEASSSVSLTIGGLHRDDYSVAVTGPRLKPYSARFSIVESTLDEPLEIPVESTEVEEVNVAGAVTGLGPYDAVRCSVVERYAIEGQSEWLTMPPYPLSPDGAFGSVRHLTGVRGVHVFVISATERAAEASMRRLGRRPIFPLGGLRLSRRPHALIGFEVEGLGEVAPPLRVSLEGEEGLETISRLRLGRRKLLADNLRRGFYTLRWLDASGKEELFGFEVKTGPGSRVEATARRKALSRETIEVRVTDGAGNPLEGASVIADGEDPSPSPLPDGAAFFFHKSEPPEPGVVLATVRPRATTRFRIARPEFLTAKVEVDAGQPVPTQVPLYRAVAIEGKALDGDGLEAEGFLEISWTPIEATPITYGEPVAAALRRGRFRALGLPPVHRDFTFRLEGSDVAVTRRAVFPEQDEPHSIGVLRLEETRLLDGTVRLPDGLPARGATVALLPRGKAYRYPLRDPVDFSKVRHRTRASAQGGFRLEGLPLELSPDLVLVAHLEGYGDAVEDPLDWELEGRELRLENEALLALDVGYRRSGAIAGYRFSLEYREGEEPVDRVFELGEIVPGFYGFHRFAGTRPGLYRVKWGLREAYAPLPHIWEDVYLPPEGRARLSLRLEGTLLRGRARLNGEPVARGWILLTYDPGQNGGTRVGRIADGEFVIVDPPSSFRAYAAVLPEGRPQAAQNIARGEALPVEVTGYAQSLRQGYLDFNYRARNLRLRFAPSFFARHPGAELHFKHKEWQRGRFRDYDSKELIADPEVHFHLLAPGVHRFAIRDQRGSLIAGRSVVVKSADVVMDFR